MKYIKYGLLALSVVLTGCAFGPPIDSIEQATAWSSQVKVTKDPYKNETNYEGPRLVLAPKGGLVTMFFRMTKASDGTGSPQLYVISDYYSGHWRFYREANTSDGKSHPLVAIAQNVSSCRSECSYREDVGITFTRAELNDYTVKGMSLKISGRGGEQVVEIPWTFILSFVLRVPS